MPEIIRRSALEGIAPIVHGTTLAITVAPPLTRCIVRGDAAVGAVFGIPLATSPCRAATLGARSALWLGPDEWLLLAPENDAVMAALPGAVVDVSHRQIALHLEGRHAATVLNGACPLDLHPNAFPVGMCTRTVFAKAEITLWRRTVDGFHLEVARSFAAYVHALLAEIAADLTATA